jgi:NADPH2:quinone reductase
VVATASTAEKRAFATRAGADEVRGYDELDDLRVDLVLDPVGGETFTRSLPLLNPLGTIVAIGFAGGPWRDPSMQWLVGRNVSVFGFYLGRLIRLEPDYVRTCTHELLTLWRDGAIDPLVGARFPLADARDAHALIEARRNVGKVVLEP